MAKLTNNLNCRNVTRIATCSLNFRKFNADRVFAFCPIKRARKMITSDKAKIEDEKTPFAFKNDIMNTMYLDLRR